MVADTWRAAADGERHHEAGEQGVFASWPGFCRVAVVASRLLYKWEASASDTTKVRCDVLARCEESTPLARPSARVTRMTSELSLMSTLRSAHRASKCLRQPMDTTTDVPTAEGLLDVGIVARAAGALRGSDPE